MASRIIEAVEIDCTVGTGSGLPSGVTDETFFAVARVGYAADRLLKGMLFPTTAPEKGVELAEAVREVVTAEELAADYDDYVCELQAAVEAAEQCGNVEEAKEDFTALPPEVQHEVVGTIGYVAPHFGVEIEFPTPDPVPRGEA